MESLERENEDFMTLLKEQREENKKLERKNEEFMSLLKDRERKTTASWIY